MLTISATIIFSVVPRVGDLTFTNEEFLNPPKYNMVDDLELDLSDDLAEDDSDDPDFTITNSPVKRDPDNRYVTSSLW